jgi:hypothetical protein
MTDVLILREPDKQAQLQAKKAGLSVVIAEGPLCEVPFDRALIVAPGITVPWALVPYGLHFMERWDAAAPLWRYGVLAQDVGTSEDRRRTAEVTLDLRVMLYAQELLFVRDSPDGRALLRTWEEERERDAEDRLAFVRALYRVKPIFCTLPRSWFGERVRMGASQRITRSQRREATVQGPAVSPRIARNRPGPDLVRVEVSPGVYVRCKPGQEEDVLKRLKKLPRAERR